MDPESQSGNLGGSSPLRDLNGQPRRPSAIKISSAVDHQHDAKEATILSALTGRAEQDSHRRRSSLASLNPVTMLQKPRTDPITPLLVFACIVFAASSFLFGYDNAIVSPVAAMTPFVQRFQGPNPHIRTGDPYVLTASNQQLVFSVPLVGSVLGAAVASKLTTWFGRKWPLVAAYSTSLAGVFLQVFAPNLAAFIVGRFLNNIITGICMAIAPLYLSEVAPPRIRGASVSFLNVFDLIAAVIAAVIAYATSTMDTIAAYQIPLAVQCAAPVVLVPLMIWLPESPLFLIQNGRHEQAKQSLRRLRKSSEEELDNELNSLVLADQRYRNMTSKVHFWQLFNKKNIERTLVAGSMFSFNQLTGIILTTTYATVFIKQVGVGNAFQITVACQACTLAGTMIAPLVLDRFGRRPIMLTGMLLLFAIDATNGGLAFVDFTQNQSAGLALIALSCIFNTIWATSIYSVSSLIPAEVAALPLKDLTLGYTIACAQTTAVITTLVVPQITSAGGGDLGAKTYLVFAGCMIGVILWTYLLVPETKARTAGEIEVLYRRPIPRRKWRHEYVSKEDLETADHQSSKAERSNVHVLDKGP